MAEFRPLALAGVVHGGERGVTSLPRRSDTERFIDKRERWVGRPALDGVASPEKTLLCIGLGTAKIGGLP